MCVLAYARAPSFTNTPKPQKKKYYRYGGEHAAPELQAEAVYGLTELHREEVQGARLVATPGCYPTTVQLALSPLLRDKLILTEDIVIDAKSGIVLVCFFLFFSLWVCVM